jgi:hypothetical protein
MSVSWVVGLCAGAPVGLTLGLILAIKMRGELKEVGRWLQKNLLPFVLGAESGSALIGLAKLVKAGDFNAGETIAGYHLALLGTLGPVLFIFLLRAVGVQKSRDEWTAPWQHLPPEDQKILFARLRERKSAEEVAKAHGRRPEDVDKLSRAFLSRRGKANGANGKARNGGVMKEIIEKFDALTAEEKQCLRLRMQEKLSEQEVAKRLNVDVATVQRILRGALKKLK